MRHFAAAAGCPIRKGARSRAQQEWPNPMSLFESGLPSDPHAPCSLALPYTLLCYVSKEVKTSLVDKSRILTGWLPETQRRGASILGSSALPVFIADSMDFVIVSNRLSCGRSSVLIRSLSRNPARSALCEGLSVIIVRVTSATVVSQR